MIIDSDDDDDDFEVVVCNAGKSLFLDKEKISRREKFSFVSSFPYDGCSAI